MALPAASVVGQKAGACMPAQSYAGGGMDSGGAGGLS